MNNFWKNKPLSVSKNTFSYLLDKESLLNNIQKDIDLHQSNITFTLNESIDNILTFINANYISKGTFSLRYSKELFSYFCGTENVCITFYYKESPHKILGFIMGKPIKVYIEELEIVTLEVNFLCIVPELRSLHLSSYIISILSKICIEKYNIISSIYTTGKKLNTQSFTIKEYYHRPLNISKMIETQLLNKMFGSDTIKKVYSSFNYKTNIKRVIEYYNNKIVDKKLINEIKDLITKYNIHKYKIFEIMSLEDITGFFENPAFHTFILKDTYGQITDFVTLFKLDNVNNLNNTICKNGYIYSFFFNDSDTLERIGEYCLQNDIFDMITVMNVLYVKEKDYYINKFIKGSGLLHYYFYNSDMVNVEPHQNGLVTI